MNAILENMITRHAIRKYQSRQIDEETLNEILTCGLYAPSAGNNQNSRIVVCQDPAINQKLGELSRYMQFKGGNPKKLSHAISADQPSIQDDHTIMSGFYNAPTVLTFFTRPGSYAQVDAAFMAENIWLAAHALGVGACYIGRTEEVFATEYGMALRKQWGIPENLVAVGNMLLGYLDGPEPHAKPRKEGRIVRV